MSLKSGEILELKIEKLTFQGAGLARHDNFVVFVSDTCPGDTVQAKITKAKSTYAEAQLLNVITPSKSRRKPPCAYSTDCGGCQWQHIEYQTQLSEKSQILKEYFQKHLSKDFVAAVNVRPSDRELNYRNRIRLHWDGRSLGYFKRGSHQIVSIDRCLIANDKINLLLPTIKEELSNKHSQHAREIDFFIDNTGFADLKISQANSPALSFRQVNDFVNLDLLSFAKKQISSETNIAYDLYCGAGNFSLFLASESSTKIIGVDLNRESIKAATQKKLEANAHNLQFLNQDVLKFLRSLKSLPDNSCFILDPPRTGCAPELIKEVLRLRPKQILFISCDPPTLVRDLKMLLPSYEIASLLGFDMFPQTFHVECLVSLNLCSL